LIKLDMEPLLRDVAIPGGRVTRMWQGRLSAAGVGIEVSEVELDQAPTPTRLRSAWKARRDGSARPVIIVAAAGPDRVLVCGPDGDPPPVASLSDALASRILAAVLSEAPVPATRRAIDLLSRAQGSGDVPGFRNRNLVSTHYVTQVLRRMGGPDWTGGTAAGERALGATDEGLLRALGYQLETVGPKEYRVQDAGNAVALAHVYADGTSLDRVMAGRLRHPPRSR